MQMEDDLGYIWNECKLVLCLTGLVRSCLSKQSVWTVQLVRFALREFARFLTIVYRCYRELTCKWQVDLLPVLVYLISPKAH